MLKFSNYQQNKELEKLMENLKEQHRKKSDSK